MQRVSITERQPDVVEIDIVAKDSRIVAILWLTFGTLAAGSWLFNLRSNVLRLFPFFALGCIAIVLIWLKGFTALVWSMKGRERLVIDVDTVTYSRRGSFVDRKDLLCRRNEILGINAVSVGIGSALEPDGIRIRTRRKSFTFGRNLSHSEAQELARRLTAILMPYGTFGNER